MKLQGAELASSSNGNPAMHIKCSGAFVLIGAVPNTGFLKGAVDLDGDTIRLPFGRRQSTSDPRVYAAGEVADAAYRQAITAAADGAKAAIDAERWLRTDTPPPTRIHNNGNREPLQRAHEVTHNEVQRAHEEAESAPAFPPPAASERGIRGEYCLSSVACILAIVQKYPVVIFVKKGTLPRVRVLHTRYVLLTRARGVGGMGGGGGGGGGVFFSLELLVPNSDCLPFPPPLFFLFFLGSAKTTNRLSILRHCSRGVESRRHDCASRD